jgi:hypothetical protein
MTPLPDADDPSAATATEAPLRASNADRQATVGELHDAVARGLLTPDEGGERLAAAYEARYRHELPPLTADLPEEQPGPAPAPGWGPLASLVVAQVRTSAAELRAGGFRSRRAVVAGVVLLLLLALLVVGIVGAFAGGGHGHGHGGF